MTIEIFAWVEVTPRFWNQVKFLLNIWKQRLDFQDDKLCMEILLESYQLIIHQVNEVWLKLFLGIFSNVYLIPENR